MKTVIDALRKLCQLKHYKDTVGKDSYYEKEQPLAWKNANEVLNSLVGYSSQSKDHIVEANKMIPSKDSQSELTTNDLMRASEASLKEDWEEQPKGGETVYREVDVYKRPPAKRGIYLTDLGRLEFNIVGDKNEWFMRTNNAVRYPSYWFEPIPVPAGKDQHIERLKWLIERSNKVVCGLYQMDKSGDHPLFDKGAVHLRVHSDLDFVNKNLVESMNLLKEVSLPASKVPSEGAIQEAIKAIQWALDNTTCEDRLQSDKFNILANALDGLSTPPSKSLDVEKRNENSEPTNY